MTNRKGINQTHYSLAYQHYISQMAPSVTKGISAKLLSRGSSTGNQPANNVEMEPMLEHPPAYRALAEKLLDQFSVKELEGMYNLSEVKVYKTSSWKIKDLNPKQLKPNFIQDIKGGRPVVEHPDGYHWYESKSKNDYIYCLPLQSAKEIVDQEKFLSEVRVELAALYFEVLTKSLTSVGLM